MRLTLPAAPLLLGTLVACEQPLDIVRAGAPPEPDRFSQAAWSPVSWLGQSGDGHDGVSWLQQRISDVFVSSDGAVYTYSDERSTASRAQILRGGRLVAHLQDAASNGGHSITVDGATALVDEYEGGPHIARYDATSGAPLANGGLVLPEGTRVEGLLVFGGELYVSDGAHDQVLVFGNRVVGAASPTRSFPVDGPGELAVDAAGRIWIARPRRGTRVGMVQAVDAGGRAIAGAAITDVDDPRDVACDSFAALPSRLVVADAGSTRQVRIYDLSGGAPVAVAPLGSPGGAMAPPTPGRLAADRFVEPNAVGVDAAGNLVVNDAQAGYGSQLAAFDATLHRTWSASALGFVFDSAVLDPEDETRAYAHAHRYDLDWTAPTPESLGTAVGLLRDPARFDALETAAYGAPLAVRRMFGARFLFMTDNGRRQLAIYRLPDDGSGELMRPVARLDRGSGRWWRDLNTDGRMSDDEFDVTKLDGTDGEVIWVDDAGGFWTGASDGKLTAWTATGVDASGAPVYPAQARRQITVPPPFANEGVRRLFYIAAQDVLYVAGFTADRPATPGTDMTVAGTTLARYAHPFSTRSPAPDWSASLDDAAAPGVDPEVPRALDVSGRYLFAVLTNGIAIVRDLEQHAHVVSYLTSARGSFLHTEGAKAFTRRNGELVLFVQDSFAGRITTHRWNPHAPSDVVARLSDGGVVMLSWRGPVEGPTRGYIVYRSSEPRRGYRRVNDLPLAATEYVDHPVAAGAAWYRVSAVGADGVESLSYEVAAGP